ncbi:tRNA (adenosine(37)-N6)-threonylcarbamoyltransferase complex transferase subunit TsaD [candidate division KSB1 bacterium]|nr:tRNA (adenosine(37)-N6)-threonylcarbamoyltransferase complex transferase subunit TsaD [candidate division KSB1 bacterium]
MWYAMIVLGIETSCDETSAAVMSDSGLLSNEISSQLVHVKYGGVVPELASRAHIELIVPVVKAALAGARIDFSQLDAVAVTYGPGLVGSILVGLNFAKAMALSLNIHFIGINHIEGHIFANFVHGSGPPSPFITLIVSGGHTQLVLVQEPGQYQILGSTKDDAAGEAFDKVSKMLELGYPGGPAIDKAANEGDSTYIEFPRTRLKDESFDFSFSGLKTAVLYHIKSLAPEQLQAHRADIAACFQDAATDALIQQTLRALAHHKIDTIAVVGGVARNSLLRKKLARTSDENSLNLFIPEPILCTDNAAMIARAGYFHVLKNEFSPLTLSPMPSLKL